MTDMKRLAELREAGQSPWLDNLSRELIASGRLQRLVEDGLCGVTSNPSIFQHALAKGDRYDEALKGLLARGLRNSRQLFFALALEDIAAAADVLRPVWERTDGGDGFISLEVGPELAFDSAATIEEATRLFESLNRRNVMIKVPGTLPGLTAIEKLIAAGVNVNVTLLFSVARYRQVMEAYLGGLEARLAAGQPIKDVASVASFFVSRVDVLVDKLLDQRLEDAGSGLSEKLRALRGRAAVANARLAYQAFREVVSGSRFQSLERHGARVQRLLWGSTSTKDPSYSDIKYVQELIGRDTVNTMPEDTLVAFADHGAVRETITEDLDQAGPLFAELAELGIDLQVVTDRLEVEGVQKFADAFDQLLAGLAAKRDLFMRGGL
ncbi:MAG: transaldolase [Acidobacteria bacterium]|nr:transaldolase [Acidobacteriota bacterium]